MKYKEMVATLRGEIHAGLLAPGQRMPSRVELKERFGTTLLTVQRAMTVLAQDGYVRPVDRSGTFVADYPPHISQYALVFPFAADAPHSQFYLALRNEALKLQRPDRRVSLYYEISGHVDVPDYPALLECVQSHLAAGIIFVTALYLLDGSPILEEAGMPRVSIGGVGPQHTIPSVVPDNTAFLPMAMAQLAAENRKRVAILFYTADTDPTANLAHLQACAATHGLELPEHCVQGMNARCCRWARQVVMALMRTAPSERPDALIITDNNLVEYATAGLLAAGIRVPDDLTVIAHTNFPWPTPSYVPVIRLGFDVRELLAACFDSIDRQRHGETPEAVTRIPLVLVGHSA